MTRQLEAVVFDLDGVLVDSEHLWSEVREELARERGGRWHAAAEADMMGMSSTEWSRYMHDVIGLEDAPAQINEDVVHAMQERYEQHLPVIDGAVEAVRATRLRVSAGTRIVGEPAAHRHRSPGDRARGGVRGDGLVRGGRAREALAGRLPRGCEATAAWSRHAASQSRTRRTGSGPPTPQRCGSSRFPNPRYPPAAEALALADRVLAAIAELGPETVAGLR